MNIQDKYFIIGEFIKNSTMKGLVSTNVYENWKNLTDWLEKKKFFGDWGYDFKNKCFLKEPEDPAQQTLF
jgi:hypothetical protein